jgi:hypothetical protein
MIYLYIIYETLEAPQAMSKEPVKCPVDTSSDKSTSERTQTDKDTNPVDPSFEKSASERTQTDKDTNQVDPSSIFPIRILWF